ncbi:MAG TPA: VWA domain-containing protein [Candidatus Angelobacter sp.]
MKKNRLPGIAARLMTVALAIAASGYAQGNSNPPDKSQATFRTTTRLVVVDVVAVNGKGEPLTDLKPEEFTVSENGKLQEVKSFSLHQPLPANARTEPSPAAPLPPGEFSNAPRYKNAAVWNIILLDFLNSQVLSQADMRDRLAKVLDKMPDDPVAVYVLTDRLHLLHDFSSDQAALKAAVAALKNKASAHIDNPKGGHEAERYPPPILAAMTPEQLAAVLHSEAQATGFNTQLRLRLTMEALNMIVRNVAALPGRKNLIWISQAFPFSIDPGQTVKATDAATGMDFSVSVPGTANALLDGEVAIYPVDPLGVTGSDEFDVAGRGKDAIGLPETNVGPTNTVSELRYAQNATHASLNNLADSTGGRAFYNRNDLGDAVLQSMRDGDTFYTLAYYPSDKNWNGKFRRISVKVARAGVKLRHRSGYFALDPGVHDAPAARAEAVALFRQALDLETPVATSLLFHARVRPPAPAQEKLIVELQLEPGAITTDAGPDNHQHVSVDCAVAVFTEKGAPVTLTGNTVSGPLKPEGFEKVAREGFPCRVGLDLPPGSYLLRLGIHDNLSGRMGTANANVSIPEKTHPQ